MPSVDRNLLRISLGPGGSEVDVAVAINEVVGPPLSAYCGDDSPRFINGVLGRIVDDIEAGEKTFILYVISSLRAGQFEERASKFCGRCRVAMAKIDTSEYQEL